MAWASTCATRTSSSAYFSGSTRPISSKAPGWGWPSSSALFTGTAGACGPNRVSAKGQRFISHFRTMKETAMADQGVENLLVEGNPTDLELTLPALRQVEPGQQVPA